MSQEETSNPKESFSKNEATEIIDHKDSKTEISKDENVEVSQKGSNLSVSDEKPVDNSKKPKASSFLTSSIPAKEEPKLNEEVDMKKIQEEHLEKNIKDEVLFKSKCTLYFFSKKKKLFEERGYGTIMISKHRTDGMIKVSMIRDGIMRYGCNHYINPLYKLVKNEKVANAYVWITTGDSVETDAPRDAKQIFLVRFEEEDSFVNFKIEFDKGISNNLKILNS